ncbi:putative nuclease HARBI1 [Hydra vulgaris]|uniref:putative nuclease HARBI1 n=1 Tax=Hydra vulgaris TaxID=6087 RepID=UPI001F5ED0B4|nr:putative nuclease HARBI1 [Hydra vulgaris]
MICHQSHPEVLILLRLLSSGSFQRVIASRRLRQFCKYFIHHYRYLVKWYESPEEMMEIKRKFFQSYGVKGLLGVVDGTMIQIKGATGPDEPAYICRKRYPALNCQVVIDHDGKFSDVVVKYPGSCHDAFIFSNSALKQTFEDDPSAGLEFLDDINFEDNEEDNLHNIQTEFSHANQIQLGI